MTPVDWINTTMVILMYRSYFSSSFDRKNIHKLSCEICLKISCTLIDWYFLQGEKPWQKIDVSVPANAEHESLQRLLSHQRISINTPYTCITNNTFWFPISNNHLMFNIPMPHLGTTRTGFLQMIQDLQFVFDSIAEVPGEFLVYNKRCSD